MLSTQENKKFEFSYWKLSYRQKLIRTLWASPLILASFLFPESETFDGMSRNQFILSLLLIFSLQIGYNFFMWKKDERSTSESQSLSTDKEAPQTSAEEKFFSFKTPVLAIFLFVIGTLLLWAGRFSQDAPLLRNILNSVSPLLTTNFGCISLICASLAVFALSVTVLVRSFKQQIAKFQGKS